MNGLWRVISPGFWGAQTKAAAVLAAASDEPKT